MSTSSTANKPAQMTIAFLLNPIASPTPLNKMSMSFLLSPHTPQSDSQLLTLPLPIPCSRSIRSLPQTLTHILNLEHPKAVRVLWLQAVVGTRVGHNASTSTVFSTPELALFPQVARLPKLTQVCNPPVSSVTRISLPSFTELVHNISSWSPPPSAPGSEPTFQPLGPVRLYGTNALDIEEFDHDHDLRHEEAEDADDELSDGDTYALDNETSTDWNLNDSDGDGTSDCPREDNYEQAWLDEWLEDEEESDLEGFN